MQSDSPDANVARDPSSDPQHEPKELDQSHGAASPPEETAASLAGVHAGSGRPPRAPSLLTHLQKNELALRQTYRHFSSEAESQRVLSYAAEWLLDNFYIVLQAIRQIREDMPRAFYAQLPKLSVMPLAGYPRIYSVARAIINQGDSYLESEQIERFTQAYDNVAPLSMGELWALPTMLRIGIIESLAAAIAAIADLEPELDTWPANLSPAVGSPSENVVVNCILSLRMLGVQDWKTFFERVSTVEKTLQRDPVNVYAHMDFETRDRYRKAVENLARASGEPEQRVASAAIHLAESVLELGPQTLNSRTVRGLSGQPATHRTARERSVPESPRRAHVGFYLLDAGRLELEAQLGYRPPWRAGLSRRLGAHAFAVYLGAQLLLTALLLAGAWWVAALDGATAVETLLTLAVVLLPASAMSMDILNRVITYLIPPRALSRLDLDEGIPDAFRTVVAVPAILSDIDQVDDLVRQLELHQLGNDDPNLRFALLTDFPDASHKHMPDDEALYAKLKEGIQSLNERHSAGARVFLLFHRDRVWNMSEGCWMGWERKRGKLTEFNRLLLGSRKTSFRADPEDIRSLSRITYVITLDADTVLPRDSARRLIATLAHPLNRAEFDPETDRVTAGYTVLQPRCEITPTSTNRSLFSQVFAQDTGLDLYTRAVSDVYQDLFGEGIYVGKGIYDVAAFERSLSDLVPDNTLLSHDLFEGIHGRAGLVTDIVLFEHYPPDYLAYVRRLHRWIRGDWQLLPWLMPRVPHDGPGKIPSRLSALDRFKIADNLRRSLVPPALLALFVTGWLALPGPALLWTLAALLSTAVPLLMSIAVGLWRSLRGIPFQQTVPALRAQVARWLLAQAFLPYEALRALDAVATTLVRLFITRRRLLQWTAFDHTIRIQVLGRGINLVRTWRRSYPAILFTGAVAILAALVRPAALPIAALLLLLWLISPQLSESVSQPLAQKQVRVSDDERRRLRRLARHTWLFFEQFVGPEDHWLPPDHFQEDPRGIIAHRTSPTNIGLLLLSTLSAHDLGYIGLMHLTLRLRDAFEAMESMERYRGHFLNWYDTLTLEPLIPRYVSTVDNGNLVACLIALKQGLQELPDKPILCWERWQGLVDTLDILLHTISALKGREIDAYVQPLLATIRDFSARIMALENSPDAWTSLLTDLGGADWGELNRLLIELVKRGGESLDAGTLRDLSIWSEQVQFHLQNMQHEIEMLLPWLPAMDRPPALFSDAGPDTDLRSAWRVLQNALPATPTFQSIGDLTRVAQGHLNSLLSLLDDSAATPELLEDARAWCRRLHDDLGAAHLTVRGLEVGFQEQTQQVERFVGEMDFTLLFDRQRHIFYLGYDVAGERFDTNHYDLLASEARIASLVAIAKGEAPQSHWLHLSRPISRLDGSNVLLSWNGSMFEYLMPNLLLRSPAGTLLEQIGQATVQRQIVYARQHKTPWGISEAGYYAFDANLNYQYRGFGVPGLGFKRGLGDDMVITPYASLLALSLRPRAVIRNMIHLERLQMLGPYGFYESIDYTPSRLALGQDHAIVRSYMAHHQGMILLALTNYLSADIMQERFHRDPRVQSTELLLHEQEARQASTELPEPEDLHLTSPTQYRPALAPWSALASSPLPQAHFLSNGRYGMLITNDGGGYSQWKQAALTRWRPDTTLDNWGSFIYVQDRDSRKLWSASFQPTCVSAATQQALFYPHMVEFQHEYQDIALRMEIVVSPEDDVEIRRLTLTNRGEQDRRLALTSYAEVVLAPQGDDSRHPAFNRLFIDSEYLGDLPGLLFRRRPRSAGEEPIYLMHALSGSDGAPADGYETVRGRFLGRGRTPRSPAFADAGGKTQPASLRASLDPIMSLTRQVDIPSHATVQVTFITLAASSRQKAIDLARRYGADPVIQRSFDQARIQSERELQQLDLTTGQIRHYQQLLSALVYPHPALRAAPAVLRGNNKGQPGLWPYAISGDYPILLVHVRESDETEVISELLRAHAYWRNRLLEVDLVLLNHGDTGYSQDLHNQLVRLVTRTGGAPWLHRRGGIFLLSAHQIPEADLTLLQSAARVILDGKMSRLDDQLAPLRQRPIHLPAFFPILPPPDEMPPMAAPQRPTDLLFDNGLGGFSPDGTEYVIYLEGGQRTPAPWVNVIANPDFGFMVSESGSGFTWAGNSGENRLTPWHNDPVSDPSGEAIYLRDEETGTVWSPTPLPAGDASPYLIRHGAGYSIFEHNSHGLKQQLRLFAAVDAPVKVMQLRLENTGPRTRRITATCYAEWVLGSERQIHQQYIIPEFDVRHNALLARNPYNEEFGQRVAFLAASKEPFGVTGSRTEFIGRGESYASPMALRRVGLAGTVDAGPDPCAAYQIHLRLRPGESEVVYFLLGQGSARQDALGHIARFLQPDAVENAWSAVRAAWNHTFSAVSVSTPDRAMDLLLNRWLIYQALSCRLWGRSALYQSSGAFGFRDQLQDVLALLHTAPDIARRHIVESARHQFEAGDVLHWWHPPTGRGVRTLCSDDLLWLPHAVAHYVAATGDDSLLHEQVPFLAGAGLAPGEHDRCGLFETTSKTETLYEHCLRAIRRGLTKGPHGLPLIGSHDWNDGFSQVGIEGRGESVWLGWFTYATLIAFAGVCERLADADRAAALREQAGALQRALEQHAWDGSWYRRAYYDDGTPLGSAGQLECQIDSIAQSWAVLSGAARPDRAEEAMRSVYEHLVRPDDRLILLFEPPFDRTPNDPGYVKGYMPGTRENGGQYTHAALWTVAAFAELGDGDRALELYQLLNPIYHSDSRSKVARYRVEPYVVAADVYSMPPYTARGGWTWYTGSASWMYRVGIEWLLGLRREGDALRIAPCIPGGWPGYEATYRCGSAEYQIQVENPAGVSRGVKQITLDGDPLPDDRVPLIDDGRRHAVRVEMG